MKRGNITEAVKNACKVHGPTNLICMLARGHGGRHLARSGDAITMKPPVYEWSDGDALELITDHRIVDGRPVVDPLPTVDPLIEETAGGFG